MILKLQIDQLPASRLFNRIQKAVGSKETEVNVVTGDNEHTEPVQSRTVQS